MLSCLCKRDVLAALASAVNDGEGEASAYRVIDRVDPILRPAARKRLARALTDAHIAAGGAALEGSELLVLAYVCAAKGAEVAAGMTAEQAAQTFEASSQGRQVRRRFSLSYGLLGILVVGAVAAAAAVVWPEPDTRLLVGSRSNIEATPEGAFARGGVPEPGSDSFREAMTDGVPQFIVTLDGAVRSGEAADAELDRARDKVLSACTEQSPELCQRLAHLLDCLEGAAFLSDAGLDETARKLTHAVVALNDQFAAENLSYLVDSNVITYKTSRRRNVLTFLFTVERVRLWKSGSRTIRSVFARRADDLNWDYNLLGFTAPERNEAIVLISNIEEQLLSTILPALGVTERPLLVTADLSDVHLDWFDGVRTRGIEIVREELGAQLELGPSQKLGAAIADRHRLFRSINRRLKSRGIRVSEPRSLVVDPETRADIARVMTKGELEGLDELNTALRGGEVSWAWERAVDALGYAVELHEVQHRVDFALDPPLALPVTLETYVGPIQAGEYKNTMARRALAEMSAYMAEVARNDKTPRASLVSMSSFLFDRNNWGTAECYAILALYIELAKAFGIGDHEPLVVRRRIQRAAVASLFLEFASRSPDDLRTGAKRAWEAAFARPFPAVELVR